MLKVRKDLLDPPIADIGFDQCVNGSKWVNEINFRTVYVSPMRRCLMTTVQMFKKHPNREKIDFKVLPNAKENTHVSNDMCKALNETFQEFSDPAKNYGMHFDFSLMHCFGREASW